MSDYTPLSVVVGSEFACFTRPEMKVERVSYDVMTPSAARGILESIFWKPAFHWRIQSITPLKPIQHVQLRRSEVKDEAVVPSKKTWKEGHPVRTIDVDAKEKSRPNTPKTRVLRTTLALKDVAYRIEANVELVRYGKKEHPAKYRDQFRRRVERGQCYRRPYLGCREFAAWFRPATEDDTPVLGDRPLGRMLFDIRYDPEDASSKHYNATPHFFHAELEDGVLHVPNGEEGTDDLYSKTIST
jgi:CRISPR-associated protein Cas5d